MKLDIGLQPFVLDFSNGKSETVYLNPFDPDLATRFDEFEAALRCKKEEAEAIDEKDKEALLAFYEGMREGICAGIDKAFGGEISASAFKYVSPFARVNGEWYVLVFVNALWEEIKRRIKTENEHIAAHLEKYEK